MSMASCTSAEEAIRYADLIFEPRHLLALAMSY
jgi:hypothetical protein